MPKESTILEPTAHSTDIHQYVSERHRATLPAANHTTANDATLTDTKLRKTKRKHKYESEVPMGSPSRGGDVAVCVFDIN